jgi:hypothetical protein
VSTTTDSPWTDEDVSTAAEALYAVPTPELDLTPRQLAQAVSGPSFAKQARAVLDALAPRVTELQRAAKVEALWWAADSFANQGEVDAADHVTALAFEIRRGEA